MLLSSARATIFRIAFLKICIHAMRRDAVFWIRFVRTWPTPTFSVVLDPKEWITFGPGSFRTTVYQSKKRESLHWKDDIYEVIRVELSRHWCKVTHGKPSCERSCICPPATTLRQYFWCMGLFVVIFRSGCHVHCKHETEWRMAFVGAFILAWRSNS